MKKNIFHAQGTEQKYNVQQDMRSVVSNGKKGYV
jgi:hypothetical protein